MITSSIYLYKVPFEKEKRFLFDSIEEVLSLPSSSLLISFSGFQFVKPSLSTSIKVDYSPLNPLESVANYVKIINYDGDVIVSKMYYYVDSARMVSTQASDYRLTLDVLNSFKDKIEFEDRTRVLREHRDRFKKGAQASRFFPVVDWKSEGISLTKFSRKESVIADELENWNIVYRSVGDSDQSGVECYLLPQEEKIVSYSSTSVPMTASRFSQGKTYGFVTADVGKITIDIDGTPHTLGEEWDGKIFSGVTFENVSGSLRVGIYKTERGLFNVDWATQTYPTISTISLKNFQAFDMKKVDRNNAWANDVSLNGSPTLQIALSGTISVFPISSVDRTDSRLVKVIKCPYPPFSYRVNSSGAIILPNGFSVSQEGMIRVESADFKWQRQLENGLSYSSLMEDGFPWYGVRTYSNLSATTERNIEFESKLLHSDFLNLKFAYDSFSYSPKFEEMRYNWTDLSAKTLNDLTEAGEIDIRMYQSPSISSVFMFSVESYSLENNPYKSEDYDGYIVVKRNNELPLYNNAYINYIRNGYNYDIKAQNLSVTASIVSTTLSAIGSIASFAAAPATGGISVAAGIGLATSAVASGASIATQISSNEISNASRLAQLQAQGTSVSGADDLGLLEVYNGLRLRCFEYWLSNEDMKMMWDLFHFKGYATDEMKTPNVTSRRYFNYLQAEIEIDRSKIPSEDVFNALKNDFAQGVTFMHKYENYYDLSQKYENLETLFN